MSPLRSFVVVAGLGITVAVACPAATLAQFGQPIYPAYQGFVDNPDGSVTMVFQYFSHGRDPVTIPPGPANRFSGVEDRNQPTTFLPGNHEFVCVLIAANREEAAALRWSIAFPEAESATSVDPLNTEYMLVENALVEANRGLDVARAPRGVCLNKPPSVRAKPRRFGVASGDATIEEVAAVPSEGGEGYVLNGSVEDEGLPRGGELVVSWRKISGPGDVSFAEPGAAVTDVSFSVPGTYELELHASDGELEASDRVRLKVGS